MKKTTKITLIICTTVMILGLGTLAVWSGATIDLEAILTALAGIAVGALGALGFRGRR